MLPLSVSYQPARLLQRLSVLIISCIFAVVLFSDIAHGQEIEALPFAIDPMQELTVDDAVAFALENNQSIVLSEMNVAISLAQVGAARANGLPILGINVNSSYSPFADALVFQGNKIGGDKLSASAQLVASQSVWPPSRWKAPLQASRATVDLNNSLLQRTRQQVTFQTRQSFYQLLAAQRFLEVAQYAVQIAEKQLDLSQKKFDAGVVPRLDIIQAEATLADAQVTAARNENSVDIARDALATQIGLAAGSQLRVISSEGIPVAPDIVTELIAQALAQRPELQQLAFRREQIAANISLIRMAQQPILSLQGSYAQTLVGGSLFSSDGLSFGANLAFNLYNGGKTRNELAAARLQMAQIDVTEKQLTLLVTQDVRAAWLNLQNATKQLLAAEKQFVAANSALEIAEIAYDAGERIRLEAEQARLRAIQALNSYQQAVLQAQVAQAQLEFACGGKVTLDSVPLKIFSLYFAPGNEPH